MDIILTAIILMLFLEILPSVPGAPHGPIGWAVGGHEQPGRGEHWDVGPCFRSVQGEVR